MKKKKKRYVVYKTKGVIRSYRVFSRYGSGNRHTQKVQLSRDFVKPLSIMKAQNCQKEKTLYNSDKLHHWKVIFYMTSFESRFCSGACKERLVT